MANSQNSKNAVIVAGMHRSGTSLFASILQSAGVNMGDRLLAGIDGNNAKGFFENLDFVELHQKILSSNNLSDSGWTIEKKIPVPAELRQEAVRVLEKNSSTGGGLWGWKDPRTTLFLDFWAEQIPNAKFVFLFRSPWEVIDSLFRRGDLIFRTEPTLALRTWEHYNRLALSFAKAHPDQCAFVDLDTLPGNVAPVLSSLEKRFSIRLAQPTEEQFDKRLLKKDVSSSCWPLVIKTYFANAYELWNELKQHAIHTGSFDLAKSLELLEPASQANGESAMKYWMETRKLERDFKDSEKILYDVRSELYHANKRIEFLERSRIWKIRNWMVKRLRGSDAAVPH